VIDRRQNHRIRERRHDRWPCFAGANASARRFNFVPPFDGDTEDVSQSKRRGKRWHRLSGRRTGRQHHDRDGQHD
jgi:hypothetical protein